MKVAPEKSYEYTVYFNEMFCRWYAKFSSTRYEISYEFPLPDLAPYSVRVDGCPVRPAVTNDEEAILALVFVQMVSMSVAAARAAERAQAEAAIRAQSPIIPPGATEQALNP